ncbi:exodeoxyribonuclease VII large subunit [Alkalihalobacillus sp. LMS39]|uniref:exodeoxyribonuclease VII large subunit n=1 Tax=Alkalihalobacillus sp. LMS39 TaxID=2924032 RepID=UPI001FB4FD7F|nr:exodeoxyribonuclease VII large subunit [Alkalihalobacillus sp. LMS39]UOE95928.1 exodeoxyribonuclease VII large subunit [Alkalihalobacillus sp. LMS39]
MKQEQFLTVTEVTRYIKRTFDFDEVLQDVWIRGELSNFKLHSRGHMYFTVKDSGSRMQAVMFAGNNRSLAFKPEDGMKVLIRGNVSVYEPYGQYQLYAREMQPDGIGNLYLAYEQLKQKLEAEGLFHPEHKKALPRFVQHIAIVTSPTGAAIKDMITTIKRRYPIAKVTLLPVLVQGEGAAPSIARAIEQANEANLFDIVIVGRGGGSIEELWAFNEELVARAIFASVLPIISAVGHETDFTIADFVADVRAATPTAAAELAVPHIEELIQRVEGMQQRMLRATKDRLGNERQRLSRLQKSYAFRYPEQLIKQKEQQLDRTIEKLEKEFSRMVKQKQEKVEKLTHAMERNHPARLVDTAKKQHENIRQTLIRLMKEKTTKSENQFQQQLAKLQVLSPLSMMDRGYNLAYGENKQLIKSTRHVSKGDKLTIRVKDGHIYSVVEEIETKEVIGGTENE